MEISPTISELAKALSKAQGEFKSIIKGSTAKIITKKGGEYSYQYADLSTVLNSVMPIVSKYELSICQGSTSKILKYPIEIDPNQGKYGEVTITTLLIHSSGEWIKNVSIYPYVENGNNDVQAIGSVITFGRRYEVCAILGIASQKDTDGILPEKLKKESKLLTPPEGVKSMKEFMIEMAKSRFTDPDMFKAWRIDNNFPESIENWTELEYAQVFNKLKSIKPKNS